MNDISKDKKANPSNPTKRKINIVDIVDSDEEVNEKNIKKIKNIVYDVGDIVHTYYGWGIIKEKKRKFKGGFKYLISFEWGIVYYTGEIDVDMINAFELQEHPVDKFKIEITDRELVMLHKGNIVNDRIVEYLLVRLYEDMEENERVVLFPSYFFDNVCDQPQSYNRSISKWKDLLNKEFIIIPICRNRHWIAVILYNTSNILQNNTSYLKRIHKKIQKNCYKKEEEDDDDYEEDYDDNYKKKDEKKNRRIKRIIEEYLNKYKSQTPSGPYSGIFCINSGTTNITSITKTIRNFLTEVFYQENSEYTYMKDLFRIFRIDNYPAMSFQLPKQKNDYDCGLYIFYYIKCFFDKYLKENYPVFTFEKKPKYKTDFVKENDEKVAEQINEVRINLLNLFKIRNNKNRKVI